MDREPPVAELVAEPLDQDRPVIRQHAGGRALLGEIGQQVLRGAGIQAGDLQPLLLALVVKGRQLPQERAQSPAELDRAAGCIALPVGHPARLTGRRGDEHLVVADVLDPPGRGAEQEDVADSRLVDHLLVELTDPTLALTDQEDAEHAAIRDRAAARDRESLRTRPSGQHAGHPVPGDPRPQLGEVIARVPPRQHVEGRLQGALREGGERRGPAYDGGEILDVPGFQGAHGDDLLGQDVERIAGVGR